MKNKFIFIGTLGIAIILVVLFVFQGNPEVTPLGSEEFESFVSSQDVFVVNSHTPYEGEIEGTDLIAENWEDMKSYKDQLPEDKNTPIVVYCRSGRMSEESSQQLLDMGYKNVYDLQGGMNEWENSGRQIIDKQNI